MKNAKFKEKFLHSMQGNFFTVYLGDEILETIHLTDATMKLNSVLEQVCTKRNLD